MMKEGNENLNKNIIQLIHKMLAEQIPLSIYSITVSQHHNITT